MRSLQGSVKMFWIYTNVRFIYFLNTNNTAVDWSFSKWCQTKIHLIFQKNFKSLISSSFYCHLCVTSKTDSPAEVCRCHLNHHRPYIFFSLIVYIVHFVLERWLCADYCKMYKVLQFVHMLFIPVSSLQ